MSAVVYLLCLFTAAAAALLLLRRYAQTRVRLLLWTGLCFVGLAVNNLVLFLDMFVVPNVDLSLFRNVPTLLGLATLVYGMVWESR